MSEILTLLWVNIDKFNYNDRQKLAISKNDAETLRIARRNLILKPGLCLVLTIVFSRYRTKLWANTKNYFIGERRSINIYKQTDKTNLKPDINAKEDIVFEYKNNHNEDIDESNKLALNSARKLKSRRRIEEESNNSKTEQMNLPRVEPTYSQEYLGFLKKYGTNVKKFAFFKKYAASITGKEKVLHTGENFLLNTKLIYLPFLAFLIFSTYDLALTYIGIYFKYQPIVDEYYNYKVSKQTKLI